MLSNVSPLRTSLTEHPKPGQPFLNSSRRTSSGIVGPDGTPSKSMAANADLFEIAQQIRASDSLSYMVIITPPKLLMAALRSSPQAAAVVTALDGFLATYGHQGYSMDFVEPTQMEEPIIRCEWKTGWILWNNATKRFIDMSHSIPVA